MIWSLICCTLAVSFARRIRFARSLNHVSIYAWTFDQVRRMRTPTNVTLIKHREQLSARAPIEEFTMHLEAPDRFATALGRTEIERGVFGWVVCWSTCHGYERYKEGRRRQSSVAVRCERPRRTWFINTYVPAFNVQPRGDTIDECILEPRLLPMSGACNVELTTSNDQRRSRSDDSASTQIS